MTTITIQAAIRYLASVCDGAEALDGQGFAASEASIGHQLASIPDGAWTDAMLRKGYQYCRNHASQLKAQGYVFVNLDNGTELEEEKTNIRSIWLKDNAFETSFVVKFNYNPRLVNQFKQAMNGVTKGFDREHKYWTIPVCASAAVRLEHFADVHDFTVTDEAVAAIERLRDEPIAKPVRTITHDKDYLILQFDYDPVVVDAVRGLPDRRYNTTTKVWSVRYSPENALAVFKFAQEHGFDLPDGFEAAIHDAVEARHTAVEESQATDAKLRIEGLGGELRAFQKAGVVYALRVMGFIQKETDHAERRISSDTESTQSGQSKLGKRPRTGSTAEGGREPEENSPKSGVARESLNGYEESNAQARDTSPPPTGSSRVHGNIRGQFHGRQRSGAGSDSQTASNAVGADGVHPGTSDQNKGARDDTQPAAKLQGRLRQSDDDVSYRSRRTITPTNGQEKARPQERASSTSSWVASDPNRTLGGCFIADEPGLGKTIQALVIIEASSAYPALVLCPASVKWNWSRETNKWLPGKRVIVLSGKGSSETLDQYDVVICNYDVVRARQDQFNAVAWKAFIADESHYLKAPKAQRTKACQQIANRIPIRLALTGTPVMNRPKELLAQLTVLGRLEDMGGFWKFVNRYCGCYRDRFGLNLDGATHLDELAEQLRSICFIRRTKEQVLKELPPKQRSIIDVPIDNKTEYREAEQDLLTWIGDRATQEADFLESIIDLEADEHRRAVAAHRDSAEARAAKAEELVRIEALKQIAAKGKLAEAKAWIENFLESDQKLVVFAVHKDIQHSLTTNFPDAARILGSDKAVVRQENVDRFQNDPDCRLIVCSLQAGGVGITLTAASNVAFLEQGWTPSAMDQAEDRLHRIGQQDSVNAWYLLDMNTIDGQIWNLIEDKRSVTEQVTQSVLSTLLERIKGAA